MDREWVINEREWTILATFNILYVFFDFFLSLEIATRVSTRNIVVLFRYGRLSFATRLSVDHPTTYKPNLENSIKRLIFFKYFSFFAYIHI